MNNHLFPFTQRVDSITDEPLPMFRDVAWDFSKDIPIIENGNLKIVEGNEALKVWIYKTVKTERYKHVIFNDDYGTEIYKYIGKNYTKSYTESEIIRDIREALLVNEYILDIKKINANYSKSTLVIQIELRTVYSNLEVEVYMNV